MRSMFIRYVSLAKRWAWMILLGVIICGVTAYSASKLTHPVYQASAQLFLTMGTAHSSTYESTTAALEALPTYAQLVNNPAVLNPVVAKHPGLTLKQLTGALSVKPLSNTQLIEVDIVNSDPHLAMQLANEVCQSFAQFSNTQLPASIQILPAQLPIDPIRPKPLQDAGIGALVGLVLALLLIFVFEWLNDRLSHPDEIPTFLGTEILTIIPRFTQISQVGTSANKWAENECWRILGACLHITQSKRPFKLLMVTSALIGEGKSTTASNLAISLAASGKSVLLVDANLRHPTLHQFFQLDNEQGFANIFQNRKVSLENLLKGQETAYSNLRVLTAGKLASTTANILQTSMAQQLMHYFKKSAFDYVIFDGPPLLTTADAYILAAYVERTMLVIAPTQTPRNLLRVSKNTLERAGSRIVGVVLNRCDWQECWNGRKNLYPQTNRNRPVDIMHFTPTTQSFIHNQTKQSQTIEIAIEADHTRQNGL